MSLWQYSVLITAWKNSLACQKNVYNSLNRQIYVYAPVSIVTTRTNTCMSMHQYTFLSQSPYSFVSVSSNKYISTVPVNITGNLLSLINPVRAGLAERKPIMARRKKAVNCQRSSTPERINVFGERCLSQTWKRVIRGHVARLATDISRYSYLAESKLSTHFHSLILTCLMELG